jgi:outer membrane protein assembly factor BamE (lipoprotein component of BamABCDE complex)
MIGRTTLLVGAVGLALTAAGCGPTIATRGNLVDDERLGQIQPGISTADDVAVLWGSPSATGTFDTQTWYYIGQRVESTAFFKPEIVERRVLVVHFTEYGVVDSIEELDLEDGQQVELVERETPTLGRSITLLEQLMGNIGRTPPGTEQ